MAIPIVVGVSLLIFLLLSFSPGDPALIAMGAGATEEEMEAFRILNGLDRPLVVQYLSYMVNAVQGDLGTSFITRQPVASMISVRVGNTLLLSFTSLAFLIVVSLLLGIAMAVKQNSFFDNFMRVVTVIMTAMPQFWLALMLILLFTVQLNWLPSSGLGTISHLILPILCLSASALTICARTGRSSVLEVLGQDFIRTARSKGLKRNYIIRRHVLKNALMPMATVYGRMLAVCFSGSVVIETIFGVNGIGSMMMAALRQKDIPAIMGSIIISSLVITAVNLLIDLFYAVIDPRIKSRYIKRKLKKDAVHEESINE